MKRTFPVIVFCAVLLFSCGGPEPYTETDVPTVYKVDSVYSVDGSWISGPDLFSVPKKDNPMETWPFWMGIAGILFLSAIGFVIVRRKYRTRLLQRSAAESQAVIALLKDRVTLVKNLAETHDKAQRRNLALSYPDELEALQETVDSYHAYLEELRADAHLTGHLEMALNAGKDKIMSKARHLLGTSVSQQDYTILACLLAGMTTASISFVTGVKPGTIRTKKSRLKQKLADFPDSAPKRKLFDALQ